MHERTIFQFTLRFGGNGDKLYSKFWKVQRPEKKGVKMETSIYCLPHINYTKLTNSDTIQIGVQA